MMNCQKESLMVTVDCCYLCIVLVLLLPDRVSVVL